MGACSSKKKKYLADGTVSETIENLPLKLDSVEIRISFLKVSPIIISENERFSVEVTPKINNQVFISDSLRTIYIKNLTKIFRGEVQSESTDKNLSIQGPIKHKSEISISFEIKVTIEGKPPLETKTDLILINELIRGQSNVAKEVAFKYGPDNKHTGQITFVVVNLQHSNRPLVATQYDEEVRMEKFSNVFRQNVGWNYRKANFVTEKIQNLKVIAVVGFTDKGKTHLTNILTNSYLEQGTHTNTLSIALMYTKDRVIIDTPGKGNPIDRAKNAIEEEKEMMECKITEQFITEFSAEYSSQIIMVVGILGIHEQKQIRALRQSYPNASIIVVHNLYVLKRETDIYEAIWLNILYSFRDARPRKNIHAKDGEFPYMFESFEKDFPIKHLIMTNQLPKFTDLKNIDYFNAPTLRYLRRLDVGPSFQPDLLEQVKKKALESASTYLKFENNVPETIRTVTNKRNPQEIILSVKESVAFECKTGIENAHDATMTFQILKSAPEHRIFIEKVNKTDDFNGDNEGEVAEFLLCIKIFASVAPEEIKEDLKCELTADLLKLSGTRKIALPVPFSGYEKINSNFPIESKSEQYEIHIPKTFIDGRQRRRFVRIDKDNIKYSNGAKYYEKIAKVRVQLECIEVLSSSTKNESQPENELNYANKIIEHQMLSQNMPSIRTAIDGFEPYAQQSYKQRVQPRQMKEESIWNEGFDISFAFYEKLIEGNTYLVYALVYNAEKILQSLKDNKWYIMGLTGLYNTGKTYIAGKICGLELKHGFEVTTTGIQVKKYEAGNILILDTEGFQRALYLNLPQSEKRNHSQELEFRNLLEDIVHSFILKYSDIVLVVMSNLSSADQELLRICQQRVTKKQQLIVVHNFFTYTAQAHVEKKTEIAFKEQLGNIHRYFELQRNHIPEDILQEINRPAKYEYYLTETITIKGIKHEVIHTIMAREGTDAGKFYNDSSIQMIRNKIAGVNSENDPKSILDKFDSHLKEKIVEFYEIPLSVLEWKEQNQLVKNRSGKETIFQYHYLEFDQHLKKKPFALYLREVKFFNIIEPMYHICWNKKDNAKYVILSLPGGEGFYKNIDYKLKKDVLCISCDKDTFENSGTSNRQEKLVHDKFLRGRIDLKLNDILKKDEFPRDNKQREGRWIDNTCLYVIQIDLGRGF